MKPSANASRRVLLIDVGPLVAAIDAGDFHHRWAKSTLLALSGRALTCEAVVAEAGHLLDNDQRAMKSLHGFLARMEIIPVLRAELDLVFAHVYQFAPRMDIADACLLALAGRHTNGIILTTDTRDFSTYRIPFASPEGLFADFATEE
jgi:predicted nucleic acid-binding protein